jgi:hypothetical protein
MYKLPKGWICIEIENNSHPLRIFASKEFVTFSPVFPLEQLDNSVVFFIK